MAKRSLSSLKRMRQNARRAEQNKSRKSSIKTQIRKFVEAIAAGDPGKAEAEFRKASTLLDRAAAHGVVHRNTAGRKKSRLATRLAKARTGKSAAAKG